MTDIQAADISADDLQLLGTFYANDLGLVVEADDQGVSIVPPGTPWRPLALMATVISCVFAALVFFLIATGAAANVSAGLWLIVSIAGVVAIVGPVAAHLLRLKHLWRQSPLLRYDKTSGLVTVHGGAKRIAADDAYALVAFSLRDERQSKSDWQVKSELQLLVRQNDRVSPLLVCTSLSSSAGKAYGSVLQQFGAQTGMLTAIAEPTGVLRTGTVTVTSLTPECRERANQRIARERPAV